MTPMLPNGEQVLMSFCLEEGLDKPGEYMAGYGIYENAEDRGEAIPGANILAQKDIATKFVGMIKNSISMYNKRTRGTSGNRAKELLDEDGANAIAAKVVEKYGNAVCRRLTQSATGGYVAYVALHLELDDAKKGLEEELEIRKVEYDRDKFFKALDEQLDKMGQQKTAE